MDWDSQLGGIIIGAILAGLFSLLGTLITLTVQGRRMKTQLENDAAVRKEQFQHDLENRSAQFDHEAEQEIRGRRTEALGQLQELLEVQKDALTDVWGIYRTGNSQLRGDLKQLHQLGVLVNKEYRTKLWAINSEITRAVNAYAQSSHTLQTKILEGQVADLEDDFRSASNALSECLKEIGVLMSRINRIDVVAAEKQA